MIGTNRNRTVLRVAGLAAAASLAAAYGAVAEDVSRTAEDAKPQAAGVAVQPINPLNAQRAYGYLLEMCAIGPRPSGSVGMQKQQALLDDFFKKQGGKVTLQRFKANDPQSGQQVAMANIIVEWHPERKERILLCAHYDTRPHADRDLDPVKRRDGVFLGANDGASGVAVLMELGHLMPKLEGRVGVDFLLVDGEELVYTEGQDPYFLGSTWFARQYVKNPPPYKYRWGVVLDMVGDTNLSVYQDRFSATWSETRPLVKSIWGTAARLGVKEFIPRVGYVIQDDHLPLRNTAKIPTCDVIDFDYPQWHTTLDNPQHCAGSSLAKVGWVVYEWLKSEESAAVSQAKAKSQAADGAKSDANTSP
jgi:glutaminyl-peptide cyclotransferase